MPESNGSLTAVVSTPCFYDWPDAPGFWWFKDDCNEVEIREVRETTNGFCVWGVQDHDNPGCVQKYLTQQQFEDEYERGFWSPVIEKNPWRLRVT